MAPPAGMVLVRRAVPGSAALKPSLRYHLLIPLRWWRGFSPAPPAVFSDALKNKEDELNMMFDEHYFTKIGFSEKNTLFAS